MKIFTTWKHNEYTYIAFPGSTGFQIISDSGTNFGNWKSIDKFKEHLIKGEYSIIKPLGKCYLTFQNGEL